MSTTRIPLRISNRAVFPLRVGSLLWDGELRPPLDMIPQALYRSAMNQFQGRPETFSQDVPPTEAGATLFTFLAVADQLLPAIDRSPEPPQSLREKVARGELGLKAGKGFYEWTPEEAAALRRRVSEGLAAIARLDDD